MNSEDSVTFELFPGLRSMGYGDGIKKTFSGKINHSQSAVEYLPGTFQLTAGGVSGFSRCSRQYQHFRSDWIFSP